MTTNRIRYLISAVLVGGALTIGTGAQAYWGGPWGDPWGGPWGGPRSGPGHYPYSGYNQAIDRTHERQQEMYDHRNAMRKVGRMLSGRNNFDRAEAVSLVREIEASAGENLTKLFKAGDSQRSPLSRARIDDMETFKANADALKAAAGALANELEKQPSAEDVRTGQAYSPDRMRSSYRGWRSPYSYRRSEGKAVSSGVIDAYGKLVDTCSGCHANFRTTWR